MDSSNRLVYILGKEKIDASEIKADEWLMLVREAIVMCKPYLKYIWGFKTIESRLNWQEDNERRVTDLRSVKLPRDISFKTKYVCLMSFTAPTEKISGGSKEIERHESFMLTQNGHVLYCRETCKHNLQSYGKPRYGKPLVNIIRTLSVELSLINEERLYPHLREKPCIGREIFKTICWIVMETVSEKEKRLEGIRDLWIKLGRMHEKILY